MEKKLVLPCIAVSEGDINPPRDHLWRSGACGENIKKAGSGKMPG